MRRIGHAVLRPHPAPEALVYEHDEAPDALHLGAWVGERLVAIASITREPPPSEDAPRRLADPGDGDGAGAPEPRDQGSA